MNPVGGGLGLGVAAAADNVDEGVAALNPLVEGGDGQEEENDSGLDNMGADEPQVNRIVKRKKTMSLILEALLLYTCRQIFVFCLVFTAKLSQPPSKCT